jgi:hypothetical protein
MTFIRAIVILLALSTSAVVLRLIHQVHSADTLTFNRSTSSNVTHILRWGVGTQVYSGSQNLGTNNLVALADGPWGRFFFVVAAVSANQVESLPSNELLHTNRPDMPLMLRLIPRTNKVVELETSFDGGMSWNHLTNLPMLAVTSQLFRASSPP